MMLKPWSLATATLVAVLMTWLTPATAAPDPKRPNVVVVVVDDLRWDELGCTGHPFARTPNIDRIAAEGATFRNAFATTPLCSPSRASILTGLYPHKNGIVDNTARDAQSHRLVTFPRRLHDAGYETAFVGKWHMGNDNSRRPGFDYWACLKGQGTSYDPEIDIDGQTSQLKGYVTDLLNAQAQKFLAHAGSASKPFVLFMAQKGLHPETAQAADGTLSDPNASQFIPAERHKTLYATDPVPRRPNVNDTLEGKPALKREVPGVPPLSVATGTSDETVRDRQRMLASIDEGVGQILKTLESTGQLDKTILVVMSDHGYFYGEHGLSVERRLAYEEAIRIPLLVRYPPLVKAGLKVDQTILTIDLAPTLLELGGLAPPVEIHGTSFVPLLRGENVRLHDAFLIEHTSDKVFPRMANLGYQAVRDPRWKYIRYRELSHADELYDLEADPYELTNRISDPAAQATLKQLKTKLDTILQETR
ncbi:sulfatase-like hydrolase/transferase [Singulisphaera sp. Ch08]|uniref:Sulfatase-like hydrolase/transferase n=1 Tax=Singulisphaera sp. Ch08 TaxID=3120278 RepID=A0AAU7CPE2_9BACT